MNRPSIKSGMFGVFVRRKAARWAFGVKPLNPVILKMTKGLIQIPIMLMKAKWVTSVVVFEIVPCNPQMLTVTFGQNELKLWGFFWQSYKNNTGSLRLFLQINCAETACFRFYWLSWCIWIIPVKQLCLTAATPLAYFVYIYFKCHCGSTSLSTLCKLCIYYVVLFT